MAFKTGDIVLLENTDKADGDTTLTQRQRRHGPYVVGEVDVAKPRVTLRVLATGRPVLNKQKGQKDTYWIATRRLTAVRGDPHAQGAGWLGVHDRGALPEGERAAQLRLDLAQYGQVIDASLRIKAADARGVSTGDGRVAAVTGHFADALLGTRVIVVLANGLATDVSAKRYPQLLRIAHKLPPSAKMALVKAAPAVQNSGHRKSGVTVSRGENVTSHE